MSKHIVDNSAKFFNNGNVSDVWNSDNITDDRPRLLTWLSPLDPGLRHWEIRERCVNNVGEWLLETEEFGRWYKSPACADRTQGGSWGRNLVWPLRCAQKIYHTKFRFQDPHCVQFTHAGDLYASSAGGEGENAVLFCYGHPGVGKTFIR